MVKTVGAGLLLAASHSLSAGAAGREVCHVSSAASQEKHRRESEREEGER